MHDVEMPLESRRLHKKLVASRQAFGSNAEQEIMLGGKNYNKIIYHKQCFPGTTKKDNR